MWCWWHNQWCPCIPEVKTIEMRCNMIFLVMRHHQFQCQCHITQMPSLLTPLHFLDHDDQNEVQHDFLVMWCHWPQCQDHATWIYTLRHVYQQTYMYLCICMHAYMSTCTYAYMYVGRHVHMSVHAYTYYIHACMHRHACIYAHTYVHISHTYIHRCIYHHESW